MDKRELLERFLKGNQLSSTELEAVIEWIEDGSFDEIFSEKLDDLRPVFDGQRTDWQSEDLRNILFKKISKNKASSRDYRGVSLPNYRRFRWVGIAASFLLVFGLGFLIFNYQSQVSDQKTEIQVNSMVTKANPSGIKTVIKLQDGSSVYLNAESSVSYPADFNTNRTIELTGEAFFEVAKGHSSPFKVRADGIETVALGTSFNVKFYEEFPLEIVLATGKVSVANPIGGENLNLLPGEGIKYNKTASAIEKFEANVHQSVFWKEGTLHLDRFNFYQLTKTLERWYGVTITVKGDMPKNGSFSGIFPNNETLINVLEAMKFAYQFEYQLNGKSLTVNFKIT